jgi:two-component system alkaline phosphatase synthesis response regulator PhoP
MTTSDSASILLVEDEENLRDTIRLNLELEGYEVTESGNGADAIQKTLEQHFDLVILDIMLPEVDGISVCETIRLRNTELPILMLSARSTGSDRVLGLKKGADDYLTKPFHLEELVLRVGKLVQKGRMLKDRDMIGSEFSFGRNKVDFNAQEARTARGEHISLSQKESMLLKLLIANRNQVVSREKILQAVWGYQVYPNTRTIDNFILNFRKYFEEDSRSPRFFHSVRGVGYKFTD